MSVELDTWPLLAKLTRETLEINPDLSRRMAAEIQAAAGFRLGEAPISLAELEAATSSHLAALSSEGLTPEQRYATSRQNGEARARTGVPLSGVLDGLQTGTKYLWDQIVEHSRRTGAASDAELVELASQMWFMHEQFMRATIVGHREETARTLLSRQQERLGLLYGLLTARGHEASSPWSAVDRLGLPRTGGYVVVAVETSGSSHMPLPRIEHSLSTRDVASAWVMSGVLQLGVVSTARPEWLSALREDAESWPVTVGISPVQTDYSRVGLAVRLARIALAAAPPHTFSSFADSPVPMSAAGSPEVTAPIVESVFGDLLRVPDDERQVLIETLTAWFEGDGSTSAVAGQLWVHQNTVRNRIRRITALTGRDCTQPRAAAELYLALSAYLQGIGRTEQP